MSWLTRIQNIPLEIITGDGKTYNPIFKNASDSTPVNESIFSFINKKGSLVKRGELGAKQFNAEFHFTGNDAIETVQSFEESAKDKRPWTLKHPYYDSVLVQPAALLNFNRNNINDIVFTTTLYETFIDEEPEQDLDIQSDVLDSIETTVDKTVSNASETNLNTTNTFIDQFKSFATTSEDYESVINLGNEAVNNINDASAFIRSTSNLLRSPARFYNSIETRVNFLKESFNELVNIFNTDQNYYENAGAQLVTSICQAAVTLSSEISEEQDRDDLPQDYRTRSQVIISINDVLETFDNYLNLLNQNQANGYLPNYEVIRSLYDTVSKTIGQLFIFAQNALQQRNYILPNDMTLITLVHRLFGNLDNISEFAEYNDITIQEILIIPKDREVIYFV